MAQCFPRLEPPKSLRSSELPRDAPPPPDRHRGNQATPGIAIGGADVPHSRSNSDIDQTAPRQLPPGRTRRRIPRNEPGVRPPTWQTASTPDGSPTGRERTCADLGAALHRFGKRVGFSGTEVSRENYRPPSPRAAAVSSSTSSTSGSVPDPRASPRNSRLEPGTRASRTRPLPTRSSTAWCAIRCASR